MDHQYKELIRKIFSNGIRQANRTGIDTLTIPGEMIKADLREGFPLLTTKKMAFKAIKGELIGFLRGYSNAEDFRKLDCKIWDQNANENTAWLNNPSRKGTDDLGRIYGVQWRDWSGIDQVQAALNMIRNDPTSRRIIITGWNPAELHLMALPPCHMTYQFLCNPDAKVLHLTMHMRSVDVGLGLPFNMASCGILLSIFAHLTGYTPGTVTIFMSDCHVYVNHLDMLNEQLKRQPFSLPQLCLSHRPWTIDTIEPDDISLSGYECHPAIKAEMAV